LITKQFSTNNNLAIILFYHQKINKYLNKPIFHPHYPSHPITLRQLLSHTASINANIDVHLNSIQSNDIGLEKNKFRRFMF
jgi:CubicO group peptidase (beta-lactamase class C family)